MWQEQSRFIIADNEDTKRLEPSLIKWNLFHWASQANRLLGEECEYLYQIHLTKEARNSKNIFNGKNEGISSETYY